MVFQITTAILHMSVPLSYLVDLTLSLWSEISDIISKQLDWVMSLDES